MNHARLELLFARAYQDLAAAQSAPLVALGVRLGLYEALEGRSLSVPELARATGVDARYLAPWLANQAASGFVTRDPSGRYALDEEQAEVFARRGGPHALASAFSLAAELARFVPEVESAMRAGTGIPAAARDERLRAALEALDPLKAERVLAWLAPGTRSALESGGRVLEIGCGSGALLHTLAAAFPRAELTGIDADEEAVGRARSGEGAIGRVQVVARPASALPPGPWDLVLSIETLHELPDPAAVAAAVCRSLAPGGVFLLSEPLSPGPDDPTPSTRFLASLEVLYCLPASLAHGKAGLGPLAPPESYAALLRDAGFTQVRRIEDPGRLVLEAQA